MPEVSRFFGIVAKMFVNDHNPPHFHAFYGEHHAVIDINDASVVAGQLPPRVLGLAIEWANIHQQELQENWAALRRHRPVQKIPPLQ